LGTAPYLRHLEHAIRAEALTKNPVALHGWETALGEYRRIEAQLSRSTKALNYACGLWYGLTRTVLFRTTHKYWSINWLTFALLSVASLVFAALDTAHANPLVFFLFAGLVAGSAFHNLSVVGQLTRGAASYEACFKRWAGALEGLDKASSETDKAPTAEPKNQNFGIAGIGA
jgi:hypothetical protein